MKLLIVESPGKIKKIRSFLDSSWQVLASVGHIRDLPKKSLGIQINEESVSLEYENSRDKSTTIKNLKQAADRSTEIYLAMDMDREGEAIAWHVGMILGKNNWPKIKRIAFTEITKPAILRAISEPRRVNSHLVNAQQSRRAVDRLVGFRVSPLLWRIPGAGTSAGRVQSVAVRMVVEREREIRNFKPQEYWSIEALCEATKTPPPFTLKLIQIDKKELVSTIEPGAESRQSTIETEEKAKKICEHFQKENWIVTQVQEKKQKKNPFPPLITSTLQQAASVRLKWNGKKTMQVAQELYEKGWITYMRTDSPSSSTEAIQMVRTFIQEHFSPEYLPSRPIHYKAKQANAQEAHECIRPTQIQETPQTLNANPDQKELYSLIWKAYVSSQMSAAQYHVTTIDVEFSRGLFRARGRRLLFDGWTKLQGTTQKKAKEESKTEEEKESEQELPKVKKGDELVLKELSPKQHFTKAPPRYTEASLVKILEKNSIGRPSTYANILDNIKKREYISEEKRKFHAGPVGEKLVDVLMKIFSQSWMDYQFTAQMEECLDRVSRGEIEWQNFVRRFDQELARTLSQIPESKSPPIKQVIGNKSIKQSTNEKCDKCGAALLLRKGKHGSFLACSAFPQCRFTKPTSKTKVKSKVS